MDVLKVNWDFEGENARSALPPSGPMALARVGVTEHGPDLGEYLAEASGNPWHNRASSHCYKACHQGVLNEVLASLIFPNLEPQNQIVHLGVSFSSPPGSATISAAIHDGDRHFSDRY